jgi:peptidylamidoglycolate lyase
VNFLMMFWENTVSSLCAAALSLCVANGDLPKDQFLLDNNWPELQAHSTLGQATGIGVDTLNRVFVFHRAGREWQEPFPAEAIQADTVFVFDGDTGTLLSSWGAGLFMMPHGLSVDADDNIWVTDVGSHQVHKLSADGEVLLTLGQSGEQGNDEFHFAQPTDVAFAKDGGVYVSDGYINARVIKFSKDGDFLFEWGIE